MLLANTTTYQILPELYLSGYGAAVVGAPKMTKMLQSWRAPKMTMMLQPELWAPKMTMMLQSWRAAPKMTMMMQSWRAPKMTMMLQSWRAPKMAMTLMLTLGRPWQRQSNAPPDGWHQPQRRSAHPSRRSAV